MFSASYTRWFVDCILYASVLESAQIVVCLPMLDYFRDLNLGLSWSIHRDPKWCGAHSNGEQWWMTSPVQFIQKLTGSRLYTVLIKEIVHFTLTVTVPGAFASKAPPDSWCQEMYLCTLLCVVCCRHEISSTLLKSCRIGETVCTGKCK